MQVVYGDVLFFINFCMDLISLYLAGKVMSVRTPPLGLVTASALGGIYGVASVFLPGAPILSVLIGIAMSFLMCFVCYGGKCGRKNFPKTVAVMYAFSLLLGGLITFAYNFLGSVLPRLLALTDHDPGGGRKTLLFLAVSAVCATLTLLARRLLSFRTQLKSIRVYVNVEGRSGSFDALVDSGNLLTDPISGRKVIVAGLSHLAGVLPEEVAGVIKTRDVNLLDRLSYRNIKRVRIIPSRSVGQGRLLIGFIPDRIEIQPDQNKSERYTVDAILAFDGDTAADFGGYAAIVPSSLVA